MSTPSPFDDKERANLVAYLDGELEAEAARSIEQKLALDPAARAEVDTLKKTWEMLDYLPKSEPSPTFTHRTLERVGPITTGKLGAAASWPRRPLLFGAGWAAAFVLSALGGYAGYQRLAPREPGDTELVSDLLVIENKRLYELIEDVEFVQELDHPDLFGAE